jgi:hypothetical protein
MARVIGRKSIPGDGPFLATAPIGLTASGKGPHHKLPLARQLRIFAKLGYEPQEPKSIASRIQPFELCVGGPRSSPKLGFRLDIAGACAEATCD